MELANRMMFTGRAVGTILLLSCLALGVASSAIAVEESKDALDSEMEVSSPPFPKDTDLI